MNRLRILLPSNSAFIAMMAMSVVWFSPACKKNSAQPSGTVKDSTYFGRLPFVIQDNYTFSKFYDGLTASGYGDTLTNQAGPFTILVPNNDAMAASGFSYSGNDNYFPQLVDPPLSAYIRYYILPGRHFLGQLPIGDNQQIMSLLGTPVYVTKYLSGSDTIITVNGSKVVARDLPATNGLIEVLSSVPEPRIFTNVWERMQKDQSISFFVTAIQQAGLESLFQRQDTVLTVLAPSNNAFSAIDLAINHIPSLATPDSILAADPNVLKRILLYHVLGGIQFANDIDRKDTILPDTVRLTMYDGNILNYKNGNFVSNAVTQDYGQYYDPVSGTYKFGFNGNPYPAVAYYYSPFQNKVPSKSYKDRPTGNGVVHVISSVMLP